MTTLPLLLLAALCQDPSPAVEAAARRDVIEMLDGELLEGRIVLERGNYLEIELEPGAVVGFRTAMVREIRRGAGAPIEAIVPAALPGYDEWFTLHDGAGKVVGWLHATQTPARDGSVALQEEWDFLCDRRQFQVTVLETADAQLRPQSCYFRERVREQRSGANPLDPMATSLQTREERIVEATVEGQQLVVHRLTPDGRTERRLPWPQDATFPLLARARVVRMATERGDDPTLECQVFDAAAEEMATNRFSPARPRLVPIDGVSVRVEEIVEQGRNVANAIWRDASAHVLRREIAGPALVAVPSTAEAATRSKGATQPAPFVAEPMRAFGLWRPNPVWEAQPAKVGTVALASALHRATITLSALPHLDAETSLATAADAVERWVLLLHPEWSVTRRDPVRVRERPAVRIECQASGRDGERALLHVVAADAGFVMLQCTAPSAAFAELQADFDAVAARLELVPKAVANLVTAEEAAATLAVEPVAPAAPAEPSVPLPPARVRVPTEADAGADAAPAPNGGR